MVLIFCQLIAKFKCSFNSVSYMMFHSTINDQNDILVNWRQEKFERTVSFSLDPPLDPPWGGSSSSPSKHVSFRILRLVTFCNFVLYFYCTFFPSSRFYFSSVSCFFSPCTLYHIMYFYSAFVTLYSSLSYHLITGQWSCGKVMFSMVSVCLSVHRLGIFPSDHYP